MVLWRSEATWAVLLRVCRHPTRHSQRVVVQTARTSSPATPPTDDGDHDPDIDLITLRRTRPSKRHIPIFSHETTHTSNQSRSHPETDGVSVKLPVRNAETRDTTHTDKSATYRSRKNTEFQADDVEGTSPTTSASSAFIPTNEKSRLPASTVDTLDPYLIHYLKSLRSKSSKKPKPAITAPNRPSPQDLDLDSLRPVDLRSSYHQRKSKSDTTSKDTQSVPIGGPSGEPGLIPDGLTQANIKALNLPSSGGKVVIPRALLVRLIEETISLSGAAVRGDDVIIERYSPTWHRFARLLRTSDLHKISSLTQSDHSDSASRSDNDVFGLAKSLGRPQTVAQTVIGTTTVDPVRVGQIPPKVDYPLPAVTEREYVVLALDRKKSRVISTRFSRLLDGSSEISPVSTDDLLKVEHLNKPLEAEGFRITAVSGSGIVVSKSLTESSSEDSKSGWLQRLLGAGRRSRL